MTPSTIKDETLREIYLLAEKHSLSEFSKELKKILEKNIGSSEATIHFSNLSIPHENHYSWERDNTLDLRLHTHLSAQLTIRFPSTRAEPPWLQEILSYLEPIRLAASYSLLTYREQLNHNLQRLATKQLAHLQKTLGATSEDGNLLQMTVQGLTRLLKANEATILLKDEDNRFAPSESSSREIFRQESWSINFDDALKSIERTNKLYQKINKGLARHDLAVPIYGHSQLDIIGILHISRSLAQDEYIFLDFETDAVQAFADSIGTFLGESWKILLCREILSFTSIAVAVSRTTSDRGTLISHVNPGAERLFRRPLGNLRRKPARDLYASDSYQEIREAIRKSVESHQNECGPFDSNILQRNNGSLPVQIHYRIFENPLFLQSPRYVIGLFSDRSRQQLQQEQHERLKNLLKNKGLAYIRVNKHHITIDNTNLDNKIIGYNQQDLRSKIRDELYADPDYRHEIMRKLKEKQGNMINFTCLLETKKSKKIWVSVDLQAIFDTTGRYEGYEGFYEDVNDLIHLQRRIDARTDKALRLDDLAEALQRNADFYTDQMRSIAHQMLTPLGSLAETLQNIREGITPKQMVSIRLKYATGQARSFGQLVRNLAYLDEILEGKKHPNTKDEHVSIRRLAVETKLNFEHLLEEKRLKFPIPERDIQIAPKLLEDIYLMGNENLLRQVFVNLVDNAIKYSFERSTILIRTISRKDQAWELQILNRGIPIPENEREKIFERGYRAPGARHRTAQGSGLGLWIVRRILEAHDATIHCIEDNQFRGWNCFSIIITSSRVRDLKNN